MSSSNLFDACQVEYGNNRVRGFKITCGKCSNFAKVPQNSMHGAAETGNERTDAMLTRKFTDIGWKIGRTTGRHRCPTCIREAEQAKPFAPLAALKEQSMSKQPEPTVRVADPPPQMSREDRRIIFTKIGEVYGDEKTGYTTPWTDKRVAEDLGVPRAWVTEIREDMFGPEGGNPAMYEQIAAAEKVMADCKAVMGEADELKRRIEKLSQNLGPLTEIVRKTEVAIAEIRKAVRP